MSESEIEIVKLGKFTWKRSGNSGEESWTLVTPKDAHLTFFCLVNYGGKPSDSNPFSGWRLTSGGPFTKAGGWTSRGAAMRGAIPFLLKFYRAEVKKSLEVAARAEAALKAWERRLK